MSGRTLTTSYAVPAWRRCSKGQGVASDFIEVLVKDVIAETTDAKTFILEIPPAGPELFRYESGQFLTVRAAVDGRTEQRCYSLSSLHDHDPDLKITVKRVPYGPVSNWMFDSLKPGDLLEVMRPAGFFTSRRPDHDLALYAAGSGITPIISIAKSRLYRHASAKVFLFYANRDEQSVILRVELNALANQFAGRFRIIHWLESVQGLPHPALIAAFSEALISNEHFICGPTPFMDSVAAMLGDLGVDRHLIHLERFTFAPIKDTAAVVPPKPDQTSALSGETTLEVTLDGETSKLQWKADEMLIDALEGAGFSPPYSCRSGSCGACICTLDSGEIKMLHNEMLDDVDIAEGLILSCQARPLSPEVKVTF